MVPNQAKHHCQLNSYLITRKLRRNYSTFKFTRVLPLDETHLLAIRGLIHQEVSTKVRQRGELN